MSSGDDDEEIIDPTTAENVLEAKANGLVQCERPSIYNDGGLRPSTPTHEAFESTKNCHTADCGCPPCTLQRGEPHSRGHLAQDPARGEPPSAQQPVTKKVTEVTLAATEKNSHPPSTPNVNLVENPERTTATSPSRARHSRSPSIKSPQHVSESNEHGSGAVENLIPDENYDRVAFEKWCAEF